MTEKPPRIEEVYAALRIAPLALEFFRLEAGHGWLENAGKEADAAFDALREACEAELRREKKE